MTARTGAKGCSRERRRERGHAVGEDAEEDAERLLSHAIAREAAAAQAVPHVTDGEEQALVQHSALGSPSWAEMAIV